MACVLRDAQYFRYVCNVCTHVCMYGPGVSMSMSMSMSMDDIVSSICYLLYTHPYIQKQPFPFAGERREWWE